MPVNRLAVGSRAGKRRARLSTSAVGNWPPARPSRERGSPPSLTPDDASPDTVPRLLPPHPSHPPSHPTLHLIRRRCHRMSATPLRMTLDQRLVRMPGSSHRGSLVTSVSCPGVVGQSPPFFGGRLWVISLAWLSNRSRLISLDTHPLSSVRLTRVWRCGLVVKAFDYRGDGLRVQFAQGRLFCKRSKLVRVPNPVTTDPLPHQGQLSVLSFRYPFHPRVTAIARKRARSFCQKCKWQVKHSSYVAWNEVVM